MRIDDFPDTDTLRIRLTDATAVDCQDIDARTVAMFDAHDELVLTIVEGYAERWQATAALVLWTQRSSTFLQRTPCAS